MTEKQKNLQALMKQQWTDGELMAGIKKAFELFDEQSSLLQHSFENLKKDLARANQQLNEKNAALSEKVDELHQMTGRLECILESIGDGVLVVDPNLCVERTNPAFLNLLEKKRKEVEKRAYSEVMEDLGNPKAIQEAIRKGKVVFDQERVRKNGDHTITVLAGIAPVRSTDGEIIGAVEVLRDITPLRLLQEKMQHQQRIAALGEMAASVAHEIRNPLGTIEGFARLLKSDLDKDGLENHSRMATKIIAGVTNLNYVITNLLTYARPLSLQNDLFDVSMLLSSVEDLLGGLAAQHGVALEFRHTGKVHTVGGDIRQLRQVLVNLGRNAVEACAGRENGCVAIRSEVRKRSVCFTVSDTGCGIPKKDIHHVFDPFFTRKDAGTGLGLSLCHKIVTAHGGEITVESQAGSGTEFTVIIPQVGAAT
ncbi:MAG: ATP-binding protein [Kiritimatiellae bacterium]|nr:ATP-binding protein [Kiritimatiellia bacterium]MDD4734873.1 ATP-binding protein [Kiritimatiellia bacterium]